MLRPAHILQLAAVALLAIGVVMVQSAAMRVTSVAHAPGLLDLLTDRDTLYAGLAILAMLVGSQLDIRELFRRHGWSNPLWLIVLGSLVLTGMTLVPGLGRSVNGSSRWLSLGHGLTFQPSELVKWTIILALAWWCARRRGVMHRFGHGLLPALLLIAVACGMIVIEDLGTAALIGVVAMCLLLAGGAKWWQMLLMLPPAAGAVFLAIIRSPYRLERLTAFWNPWADPAGAGYHPIQSMLAIVQGGLWGRGLGFGIQKFGYLPEDTTDFIFAVICEELGIVGAALVIALYLVILWVGLGIVRECEDTFGRLVGLGILLMVGIQAAINIAVVTVVVPTKGIALPLVSAGGTGWILTAFAIGLVASLDNANDLAKAGTPGNTGKQETQEIGASLTPVPE